MPGKFDCIISAMTITKERAEKVLFSMPYADASNVIFLRADETNDQDRRRPVRQGHRRATRQRRGGDRQDVRGQAEGQGPAGLQGSEAVRALPRGVSGPAQQARRRGDQLEIDPDGGDPRRPRQVQDDGGVSDITAYFGMAFRKEDGALRDFFNTQLAAMKHGRHLDKLQEKWFGATMADPEHDPRRAALISRPA
jgi:polar amino acid transport system substrate-binding protein